MLETTNLSILLIALDFLFDEGRKILQERRERRKSQVHEVNPRLSDEAPLAKPQNNPERLPADMIMSKEQALKQLVNETALSAHESEIRHLLVLLNIHRKNYRLHKEQYVVWGRELVPSIIVNSLEKEEDSIAETMRKLQSALSAVYAKPVVIEELDVPEK